MSGSERHLIIVVEESDSSVGFYDSQSGEVVGRVRTGFWPHEIVVSDDKKTAYVTNFGLKDYDERIGYPGGSISVIDIPNMVEIDRLFTFTDIGEAARFRAPHAIKISPSGKKLYVNVEAEDTLLIFDLTQTHIQCPCRQIKTGILAIGNEPVRTAEVLPGTHNFIFSPKGSYLWIAAGPRGIMRYELDEDDFPINPSYVNWHHSSARGLTYTKDEKFLVVSGLNEVLVLSPDAPKWEEPVRRLNNLGQGYNASQFLYSACTPDGKHLLAPAVWESVVIVIDLNTGEECNRIPVGMDPIHAHLAPDGLSVYISHGRSPWLTEINISTESPKDWNIKRRIATEGGPNGIATAPYHEYKLRKPLVFGAALPLSGPSSAEGREIRLGYEMWKETVNAGGGMLLGGEPYQIETVYIDIQSDNQKAKPATEELIRGNPELLHPKVDFMLGNYPTPANLFAGEVADAAGIPYVTSSGAGSIIYKQGSRYVFGIMSPAQLYLSGTIEVALQHLRTQSPSVAFVSCEDPAALEDSVTTAVFAIKRGFALVASEYMDSLPEDIKDDFELHIEERDGVKVSVVKYKHNLDNFEHFVAHMKRTLTPDLFLHTGHLVEGRALIAASEKVEFLPAGMGLSVGPALPSFRTSLEQAGISANNLFGAAQWTDNISVVGHDRYITPSRFAEAFYERYSMPVSYLGAGAYTCGTIYENALRIAGDRDPIRVRDALASTNLLTFFSPIKLSDKPDSEGRERVNYQKIMYTIQLQKDEGKWKESIVWPPVGATWPLTSWRS